MFIVRRGTHTFPQLQDTGDRPLRLKHTKKADGVARRSRYRNMKYNTAVGTLRGCPSRLRTANVPLCTKGYNVPGTDMTNECAG